MGRVLFVGSRCLLMEMRLGRKVMMGERFGLGLVSTVVVGVRDSSGHDHGNSDGDGNTVRSGVTRPVLESEN